MEIVIKPAKNPPRLNENDCLSLEAQATIKALEQKYNALTVSMLSASSRHKNKNPADYYKRIYENTFKKEVLSQPHRNGQESSLTVNQNHPWQRTYFKKSSIDHNIFSCAQERNSPGSHRHEENNECEKTFSKPSLCIDSPLIESGDNFDCSSSRRGNRHGHLDRFEASSTAKESSLLFHRNRTESQEYKLQSADSKSSLLTKWNRKFSQIASQFEGEQEKCIAKDNFIISFESQKSLVGYQINPESIWIDDLQSQPENICSDSNSRFGASSSPLPFAIGKQNEEDILLSSEDPFTIFSVRDQDNVGRSFSCVDKKEQNVPEIPNISVTSKSICEVMEYNSDCVAEPYQSEDPIDVSMIDLFSPSESKKEKLLQSSDTSIFANELMQKLDDCDKKASGEKQRNFQIGLKSVGVPCVQETGKRKSCTDDSTVRTSLDAKEDPLSECKFTDRTDPRKDERHSENESATQTMVKRFKSGFKPPTKERHEKSLHANKHRGKAAVTAQPLKCTQSGLPSVVDYFTLPHEKQREVAAEIKSTHHATLTLVMSNGKALVNVFDSGVDCIKDPSVMVLTAECNCYQLTMNADTMEEMKALLLQILCRGQNEILIPNSKAFLSSLYKVFDLDTNSMITCGTLEDPVIASWLLNPDKPPSSFAMMCQTAHLKFNEAENDWLPCLQFTKKLMNSLKKRLDGDNLMKLYRDIEMKLVPLLACMENQSLKVDIDIFRKFADILKSKLHKLEESAYKQVGHKFTLNSHLQLRQILYDELKLDEKLPPTAKIGKTSVSHHKSTCESSLLLLTGLHPLPTIVLEHRSLQKLKSTYIDGMLSCMSNNSISTHWDQTSAATGRITSYQPNVQNIPKAVVVVEDYLPNTILGSAPKSSAQIYAREPFVCHEGFVFLAADFQQIELRILAHLSEDKALLSMFWNPDSIDIFSLLTAEWKSIDVDKVSNEERETTKRLVYSVMYGVGKDKLAVYLKVKPDIAKEIMKNFLARFPAIDSFTKKCCSYAKEYGYTETICGRRRYFAYINSSSPALRAQAQRQAVNFCVQGSAADICKLAMLEVESNLKKHPELNYRLLLQIHDELLWEVAEDHLLQVKETIESVMENAKVLCQKFCSLQVPLTVSFSRGQSWAHLSPLNANTATSTNEV